MFEEFEGKNVLVVRKNEFKHEGFFLRENDYGIFIDDKKEGDTFISFDDIEHIKRVSV